MGADGGVSSPVAPELSGQVPGSGAQHHRDVGKDVVTPGGAQSGHHVTEERLSGFSNEEVTDNPGRFRLSEYDVIQVSEIRCVHL